MFVEMGSTLIDSVKQRDNWVFAGRTGIKIKSFFEQVSGPCLCHFICCICARKDFENMQKAEQNT